MRLIPYLKKRYETDLPEHFIFERVRANTSNPEWDISFNKIIANRVPESEIQGTSFRVVMGRYALSYGRTSLLPIMKGHVKHDDSKSKTILTIVIRPFIMGAAILSFFYLLAFLGITISLYKSDMKAVLFLLLFIVVTYSSLMLKYNRELKAYLDFLEMNILAPNKEL